MAVIHVQISSIGSPAVILAFWEVFARVTKLLFPPWGAAGLLHSDTGGTWEAVPDVTNGVTGIKGRRSWLEPGGGMGWESLTPVMGAGSPGRQILRGDREPVRGCFQRAVGMVGLA